MITEENGYILNYTNNNISIYDKFGNQIFKRNNFMGTVNEALTLLHRVSSGDFTSLEYIV